MPEDSGNKRRKMQPEEAIQLLEEIEVYLRSKITLDPESPVELGPFEQRLVEALKAVDPEFFDDIAALFRERRDNRHPSSKGNEPGLEKIALLARSWLESLQKPIVNADTVRSVAETIWAARAAGYKPDKNLVFTQTREDSLELWVRKGGASLALEKKQVPFDLVIQRPPGSLSELDFVTALHHELASPENVELRARIGKALLSFPKGAWKRVWKSPGLCDLKRKPGRRKKH